MLSSNKTLNAFLVGLLSIVVGSGYLFVLPRFAGGGEARVRAHEPLSAGELRERPAGSPVVVEGVIGDQNEIHYRSLVAYRRVFTVKAPDGHTYPVEEDRVTPPLVIELPGGSVQLEGRYLIEKTTHTWATKQYNYEGFNRGSKVLVVGELTSAGTIRAELVAGGDRSSYLLSKTLDRWSFYLGGFCAVVLGIVIAAGALAVWRAKARQP